MSFLVRRLAVAQTSRLMASKAVSKASAPAATFVEVIKPEKDHETHTGQHWDKSDFRNARFVNKTKLVNDRFAINIVAETAPIKCTKRVVSCDGGGGPLGHPKVFINLDQPGNNTCGYCGLRFYLDHDHHH